MQHKSTISEIVSRETLEKLEHYASLLKKWSAAINLVAEESIHMIWERHIVDCCQLVRHITKDSNIMDVGSGGGLPAMILAICCDVQITMVESDKRKALFLHEAIRELQLKNATVINQRVESIAPLQPHIITARACAPLAALFPLIEKHCSPDTVLFLLKGKSIHDEIMVANRWGFEYELYANAYSDGYIIKISHLLRKK